MSLSVCPLSADETITISMASIPEREEGMLATVERLLPYCDYFDVCLNNYPNYHYPTLDDPKITIIRTREDQKVGARGKFYLAHRTPGYHLTVDDDIDYPYDYVPKLIAGVERYGRKAVVGVHGKIFTYPESHILLNYANEQPQDWPVHMLGTGTIAWHGNLMALPWHAMQPGKVDDQVAAYAQDNSVPMIVLAHPGGGWMRDKPDLSLTCSLRRDIRARRASHDRIMRRKNWRFFTCVPTS